MSLVKREQGQQRNGAANVTSLPTLLSTWDWWLSEIFPHQSDLALFLPFIPAVKVWASCHNCSSVISLSQYLWKKRHPAEEQKKKKKSYMFLQLFSHNSWIYTQLEGESERRQAAKKRGKNGGSLIHYTLCTCISEYYSYQATNTTVG